MKSIKKFFYLVLFLTLTLPLYGANDKDMDFDGVDDIYDKCPNTAFSDLTDASGCSVSTLMVPIYYDVIVGYNYSSSNQNTLDDVKTINTTIQADISKDNLSLQFLSSYYKSDGTSNIDEGLNDTELSVFYAIKLTPLLKFQAGTGVIFPTYSTGYNNEAMDYTASLSLEYSLQHEINIFAGSNFTKINDDDVVNKVAYQDTSGFYGGISYMSHQNVITHTSYSYTQSMYVGVNPIETIACGVVFPLDMHWFAMIDYVFGLSDSASEHEIAIQLGYAF